MKHLLQWRVWFFGLLSWLIPFISAFAFFNASGELAIAEPLFKSLMVVIGGGVGTALLVLTFRRIDASLASGLVIGGLWLILNLLLDVAVLLPMSGMEFPEYLADIGLRYLMIPIIAVAMGVVANRNT